jgi:peptidoglycan hydrolase-like protein with peptidoglycan-binding domain
MFLLLALAVSPQVLADEETCVEGSGAAAVRACQAAISAGSTRRSVFLAYGRFLERSGRHAEAVAVYKKGLRANPGDSTLKSKLKVAQSNLDEQKFLSRRSGGSSAGAEAKARFKVNAIRCKTLTGAQAVAACKSALSVKPGDPELTRRLKALSGGSGDRSVAEAGSGREQGQSAEEAARLAAEAEQKKALIANIQDRLTRLGLDPGPVDGLPGARTRDAVAQFASLSGVELPGTELDQAVSDALDKALEADERARTLLEGADQSIEQGNLSGARDAISQALALAPWSSSLREEGQRLSGLIDSLEESQRILAAAADLEAGARTAQESGDLDAGLALVDQALELTPDNPDLAGLRRELVAQADLRRQQQAAAEEEERRNQEVQRLLEAAKAALEGEDLDTAQTHIREGIALAPADPRFAEQQRLLDAAVDQRKRAQEEAERRQQEIDGILARASDAAGRGDPNEGRRILAEGLVSFPQEASLLGLDGRLAGEIERLEQEREEAGRREAEAERQLAAARTAVEQQAWDSALSAALTGLQQVPDHPELLAVRDSAQTELDRLEDERARAEAERQRELTAATERRAQVERLSAEAEEAAGRGDLDGAIERVAEAREIEPGDPGLERLQRTLRAAGLREDAVEGYQRAGRMAEEGAEPEQRIAVLDEALALMGQARDLNPNDPSIDGLSARIEEARSLAGKDLDAQRERQEHIKNARTLLRERARQLAKVEAEVASRELRAKLEAQQTLERLWDERNSTAK